MRSMEEANTMINYFDKDLNPRLKKAIEQKENNMQSMSKFSQRDRQYGIQRIMFLMREKDYKNDTLFMAAHIFDKYLYLKGHWNFPVRKVVTLFTTSMLIAAKFE